MADEGGPPWASILLMLLVIALVFVGAFYIAPIIGTKSEVNPDWVEYFKDRDDTCIRCLSEHNLTGAPHDYDNLTPFALRTCLACRPDELR
jgi:hypothetical protein